MLDFQTNRILTEIEQVIDGQTCTLVPDAEAAIEAHFAIDCRFAELNHISRELSPRQAALPDLNFQQNQTIRLPQSLRPELCDMVITQMQQSHDESIGFAILERLLPVIVNEQLSNLVSGYFDSEFALAGYCYSKNTVKEERWQCVQGPQNMLCLEIYLDDQGNKISEMTFLDVRTTTALKKSGVVFNHHDIPQLLAPLSESQNVAYKENTEQALACGEALLFNPSLVARKPRITAQGESHVLRLMFIPSPYSWQFTKDKILNPTRDAFDFAEAPATILKYLALTPADDDQPILIPSNGEISRPVQLKMFLRNIYAEDHFADTMFSRLLHLDPKLEQLNSINALLETLKMSFKNSINWEGELGEDNIRNLAHLAKYEVEFKDSLGRYAKEGKIKPAAIFWPTPDHPKQPSSRFDTLPYINKYPLLDKNTPIGSAGSCFAQEIAKVFQLEGFNYIITERNDDPAKGMVVDNYEYGDELAIACANYGILFNTPSFKQLAERAFGVKPTKKLVFQRPNGYWHDPYRENVVFGHEQAFIEDYQSHIDATRRALEQVEVFIITLGLNECWQFRDGSVMSRNPSGYQHALVTHKTLTVQENVDNIQTFFDIVKQHNPGLKLIISISPVPFMATGHGTEHHVIEANTHSKAVLRVAAEQLIRNNEDMYYLPSYELVTQCIKDPWSEDDRHVKLETVQKVVGMFNEIFTKTD